MSALHSATQFAKHPCTRHRVASGRHEAFVVTTAASVRTAHASVLEGVQVLRRGYPAGEVQTPKAHKIPDIRYLIATDHGVVPRSLK